LAKSIGELDELSDRAKALKDAVRTIDEYNSRDRLNRRSDGHLHNVKWPAVEHEKDLEKLKSIHDQAKGVDKKFENVK